MISDLKNRVDALYLEYVFPVLATLRLGEDPATVALAHVADPRIALSAQALPEQDGQAQ